MVKIQKFPDECDSRSCKDVFRVVRENQVSKDTTTRHPKGGLGWTVLEPARVTIKGKPRIMQKHGVAVHFRRCYVYEYLDKKTRAKKKATCTDTAPRAYAIPEETLRCYHNVSSILEQRRKITGGRPGINHKVLSAVACRSAMDKEPMTPALVSAVLAGRYDRNTYNQVRRSMENLVKTGKVKVSRGARIKYIGEEEHRIPEPYLSDFRKFVKGDVDQRVWAGVRRLFGKQYVAPEIIQMPEPTIPKHWFPAKGFRPQKLSKAALERWKKQRDVWAEQTGLGEGRLIQIKRYRKREEERHTGELGGKPTAKMLQLGFT